MVDPSGRPRQRQIPPWRRRRRGRTTGRVQAGRGAASDSTRQGVVDAGDERSAKGGTRRAAQASRGAGQRPAPRLDEGRPTPVRRGVARADGREGEEVAAGGTCCGGGEVALACCIGDRAEERARRTWSGEGRYEVAQLGSDLAVGAAGRETAGEAGDCDCRGGGATPGRVPARGRGRERRGRGRLGRTEDDDAGEGRCPDQAEERGACQGRRRASVEEYREVGLAARRPGGEVQGGGAGRVHGGRQACIPARGSSRGRKTTWETHA